MFTLDIGDGMDKQRIYDAMLIKAFRGDKTVNDLRYWLRPYDIGLFDPSLKRQPPKVSKMRIQIFVGSYLKPLADRLWDTDKTHDINTLNWMVTLENQNTNRLNQNERQNLSRRNTKDRRRSGFLAENLSAQKTSNQWGVTKSKAKTRRAR
jgi:hypothetical protein